MSNKKQLHFGAFMRPASIHSCSWRYPEAFSDANFNFKHHIRFAQTLEKGLFDALFMADHVALLNMPDEALKRSATVVSLEPLTLLPALAAVTEHIGLIATASTTYNEPYHIARKFASLDHISEGRAGWNVVTSANPLEALNFGLQQAVEHDLRYKRARECYEVVTKLWDSWEDDAIIRNKESGIFADLNKLHPPKHKGEFYAVEGALNVARPVQGWPLIVQAGASEAGRQFASEVAEMVFSAASTIPSAQEYYADIKTRAKAYGRNPDHLKVFPGCFVIIGDTLEEAKSKKRQLDSMVDPSTGMGSLSVLLGCDASTFELDAPLPDIPETNAGQTGRQKLVDMAREDNMTARELAQYVGGSFGCLEMVGTVSMIADQMEEWLEANACDGFNIMFPYLPQGLDDFVDKLVPELQKRGVYRTRYEGNTLRENLGLPRPKNQYCD